MIYIEDINSVSRFKRARPLFQAVLRLSVSPQVHFALEAFAARVAAERFEAGVFPAVCDEVGALTECFSTHLAFVRLFT